MASPKMVVSRSATVDELIRVMGDAMNGVDCEPVEVLSACLQMTQSAVRHCVVHSTTDEAKIINQRVALTAIDALKFAAIDSHDARSIH